MGNIGIISFSNWNSLTDLPVANGLVYFIASMMCAEYGIGQSHEDNIGCVNDFWWDKTGIDIGMKDATICKDCQDSYKGDSDVLQDINNLLNLLSQASRAGKDILEVALLVRVSDDVFDVFLCHNTDDKPFIRKMNDVFKAAEIRTWFDEEQVEFGQTWQVELENQIENISAVCVFVGENGIGPWEEIEIRAFLSEFVRRDCRVIPVILPNTKKIPKLPIFLREKQYCDLRKDYELNIQKLIKVLKKK